MKTLIKTARKFAKPFRVTDDDFRLKDFDPSDTLEFTSEDKPRAKETLTMGIEVLAELQNMLYAQDSWSVLLIFQAMDAAGKDGAIKHVMSGVNPQGCQVFSFKAPPSEDLDHDYMWRCMKCLPERGRMVFSIAAITKRLWWCGCMERHWSVLSGKSRAALHNKFIVFDRKSVFIGSFNFDPRSSTLNTEVGVMIDSIDIANQAAKIMDEGVAPGSAYQVKLDEDDRLVWTAENDGEEVRYDADPETNIWNRFLFDIIGILPIEDQL